MDKEEVERSEVERLQEMNMFVRAKVVHLLKEKGKLSF